MGAQDLWLSSDLEVWKLQKSEIFEKFKDSPTVKDELSFCYSQSSLFQLYKLLTMVFDSQFYLSDNDTMQMKRTLAQIRLANKYQAYFSVNKRKKLNSGMIFTCCSLQEQEDIEHLVTVLPAQIGP